MPQTKSTTNNFFNLTNIIGIFLVALLIANVLGYLILALAWDKRFKSLEAGQVQIAGFLMVPAPEKTGPIKIFYDVGKDDPTEVIIKRNIIVPNEKLIPKDKGGKNE